MDQPFGPSALTNIAALPVLPAGIRAFQYSSYDRRGQNSRDGFDGTYSSLYKADNQKHILLQETGAGCISRIWMTKITATNRLYIYFDGESSPRIDITLGSFFSGTNALFPFPLVGDEFDSSGGFYSYVPMIYTNGCIIAADQKPFFYHVTGNRYAFTEGLTSWTTNLDWSATLALWTNCGAHPNAQADRTWSTGTLSVAASQTGLLCQVAGRGAVTALMLDPCNAVSNFLTNVWLRMTWDGVEEAQVYAPIGDFFGCRFREVESELLLLGMRTSGYWYAYMPMPFWTSALIQLENRSTQAFSNWLYAVEVDDALYDQSSCGWFFAKHRDVHIGTADGVDFHPLSTGGWGRVLGINLGILNYSTNPLAYLEGDERIYVDGARTPQLYGTGTEDFFNGGWYFNKGTFSLPLHSQPARKHEFRVDWNVPPYITNNFSSICRFFMADALPFYSRIRFGLEHGPLSWQVGRYSSVAYYYRHPYRTGLVHLAAFDVADVGGATQYSYAAPGGDRVTNEWAFQGDDDGILMTATGYTGLAGSRFEVALPATNAGLLLRCMKDAVPGMQQADVHISGAYAGSWLLPDCNMSNVNKRWHDAEFIVPASLTVGRTSVLVSVSSSNNLWSEYQWQVYALDQPRPTSDYDRDSLPDAWEAVYFTNILNGLSQVDQDGDGVKTYEEYVAGTDPVDSASVFSLQAGNTTFSFQTQSERIYDIGFKTNLTEGDWLLVQTGIMRSAGTIIEFQPENMDETGYYRVQVSRP